MLPRALAPGRLVLVLGTVVLKCGAAAGTNQWEHGWASASEMTFADFNSNTVLTDAQATDVAAKYAVVSLEKCSGVASGVTTEEAIYATAKQLKAKDPKKKVPPPSPPPRPRALRRRPVVAASL
jgi:hypothetical protein